MSFLLDTNVCIVYLQGRNSKVLSRLRAHAPTELAVCSTVRSELMFGALRSSNPERRLEVVRKFLEPLSSVAFDDAAADRAAEIRAELSASGLIIGPYDLQIAATALVHDLTLVTHNKRNLDESRACGLRTGNSECR